jgi:hypothetical protein
VIPALLSALRAHGSRHGVAVPAECPRSLVPMWTPVLRGGAVTAVAALDPGWTEDTA